MSFRWKAGEVGKGPVFAEVLAPLDKLNRELAKRNAEEVARRRTEYEVLERRSQRLLSRCGKEEDDAKLADLQDAASGLAGKLAGRVRPEVPTYFVNDDFSVPALQVRVANNEGRIGVFSSEGSEFFKVAGGKHDSRGENDARFFLSSWNGEDSSQLRIGRASIQGLRPYLTVCLSIQNAEMERIRKNDCLRDLGLFNRFLWMRPDRARSPLAPKHAVG
jgi:hypothetical protein